MTLTDSQRDDMIRLVEAELAAMEANVANLRQGMANCRNTLNLIKGTTATVSSPMSTSGALTSQREFNPDAMPLPSPSDGRARRLPTEKQLAFIDSLTEDKFVRVTRPLTSMLEASYTIDQLRAQPDVEESKRELVSASESKHRVASKPLVQEQVKPESKLDFAAMSMIQNGRYAVTSNDQKQTAFIRVRDDKKTGARVVQGKSSDMWVKLQTYYPSGQVLGRGNWQGTPISDLLTQIMLDREECADRYGARFSECVNCGRELTDDKSRYYRLGSECIHKRHDLVDYINEKDGEYFPGAASRD